MEKLLALLPSAGTTALIIILLMALRRYLNRGEAKVRGNQFRNQMIMVALSALGAMTILLVVPIKDEMRGQVLGLIGVVLSAAIALSSTTVLGNAMAGFMTRNVRNFRMGDFIQVGDHFGRVSERGLFHVEIQNEDRELITIPNIYLVTNPVTTTRSSGTIVSTSLSLGYDVPSSRIEECLLHAANETGLTDPFVQITSLNDFSVTYRIAGLLTEIKRLISTRAQLRQRVLDCLHKANIEIVSPTFMNTRNFASEARFIPRSIVQPQSDESASDVTLADQVFDKAEEAESLENLKKLVAEVHEEITQLQGQLKEADEAAKEGLEKQIKLLQQRHERLAARIQRKEEVDKKD